MAAISFEGMLLHPGAFIVLHPDRAHPTGKLSEGERRLCGYYSVAEDSEAVSSSQSSGSPISHSTNFGFRRFLPVIF